MYGRRQDDGPADCAIVLGAAVIDGVPSPVLAARLDHAIDLYKRGRVRVLILTGGVGDGDTISEADAGALYVTRCGVPRTAIMTESISRTTQENARESRRLMTEQRLSTSLLVSDPLHMRRAAMVFRAAAVQFAPSPTPFTRYTTWRSRLPFLISEIYYQHKFWWVSKVDDQENHEF